MSLKVEKKHATALNKPKNKAVVELRKWQN